MNYTASGSVLTGGCSSYSVRIYYPHDYFVGDVVYFKPKAQKGIYEKIVIKDIRFPTRYDQTRTRVCKFCDSAPLYVDTLNALYNESELIDYDNAVAIVEAYLLRRNTMLEANALLCK